MTAKIAISPGEIYGRWAILSEDGKTRSGKRLALRRGWSIEDILETPLLSGGDTLDQYRKRQQDNCNRN